MLGCAVAKRRHDNQLAKEVPVVEVVEKPKERKMTKPGKTASRQERETYNAYMRVYMKDWMREYRRRKRVRG